MYFIIQIQIIYGATRLWNGIKSTNLYLFSKGGSVLAQLNVAFFTIMHPSAAKRKLIFIKVPMQAATLCAHNPKSIHTHMDRGIKLLFQKNNNSLLAKNLCSAFTEFGKTAEVPRLPSLRNQEVHEHQLPRDTN